VIFPSFVCICSSIVISCSNAQVTAVIIQQLENKSKNLDQLNWLEANTQKNWQQHRKITLGLKIQECRLKGGPRTILTSTVDIMLLLHSIDFKPLVCELFICLDCYFLTDLHSWTSQTPLLNGQSINISKFIFWAITKYDNVLHASVQKAAREALHSWNWPPKQIKEHKYEYLCYISVTFSKVAISQIFKTS